MFRNFTNIPDTVVLEIITAVSTSNNYEYLQILNDERPFYGAFHTYCNKVLKPVIRVHVGSELCFPCKKRGDKKLGYLPCLLKDRVETLVYITAHEFKHLQQFESNLIPNETEADAYGIRKMREWRKRE